MKSESDCVLSERDMAAASAARDPVEDLCEEATCSICLEYFKDPVSVECGHNFCRDCMTQFCEKSGTKKTSCPQCRKEVLQSNIRPNRLLANFVEITKKLSLQGLKREEGRERVCGKHQEPLKLFCKEDDVSICVVCDRSKEHRNHTVIPIEEAAQDFKVLMGIHQDVLEKEEENILAYKVETEEESQYLLKQIKKVEKTLGEIREMRQFLEEQEKHLQAQMEELRKQVARKRDENMVIFDQELSSLKNLFQEIKEKCQQPPAELLQDVRSLLQRYEKKKTFEKPVAFSPELKWKISEFCHLNSGLVSVMKQFQDTLLPDIELQKANVTLDPVTASPWLFLSKDCKSVRCADKRRNLPDNPERFSDSLCVLGREGFTKGRHFWEVAIEGKEDWFVGVARKSVRRKGLVYIGPSEGIWAVGKWRGRYCVPRIPSSSALSLSEKTKRIRVCLNFAANRVAFYDADTGDQIYILSSVPFSGETILPFFYMYGKVHLKISP
nr:PREDICTED: tripartite motif-containing protein 7 isoform X2 [Anolis carolinensis]|eukprot:XP_016847316.1 PREDICTED: tripartite motif-containing protein 7 isoform X2 [Anolis carolinensis]